MCHSKTWHQNQKIFKRSFFFIADVFFNIVFIKPVPRKQIRRRHNQQPIIQHADQIVILEDGHIHAVGTHDELLAHDHIYQDIYYSQLEGAGL